LKTYFGSRAKMRDGWRLALTFVVLSLSLSQPSLTQGASEQVVSWDVVDKPAAPFTLTDLDGHSINLADLSGKVIILDFWATWCSPCLKELPELAVYVDRIKDRQDVVFLSLNVTDSPEDLIAFAQEHNIVYPIYSGDELLEAYEVFAFPTKLILDLRGSMPGKIRYRHFGFTGLTGIEEQIAALLAQ